MFSSAGQIDPERGFLVVWPGGGEILANARVRQVRESACDPASWPGDNSWLPDNAKSHGGTALGAPVAHSTPGSVAALAAEVAGDAHQAAQDVVAVALTAGDTPVADEVVARLVHDGPLLVQEDVAAHAHLGDEVEVGR